MGFSTKSLKYIQKYFNEVENDISEIIFNIKPSGGMRQNHDRFLVYIKSSYESNPKIIAKVFEDKKILNHEFETMNNLDLSPFKTPSTIKLFSDFFLMEKIKGNPLSDLILELDSKNSLLEILKSVTEDLFLFHSQNFQTKDEIKVNGKTLVVNRGFTHGDFDPFNLIINKDNYFVIDWEDFEKEGIQEFDLIHFLIMLGVCFFKNESTKEKSKKIISGEGNYGKYAGEILKKYSCLSGKPISNLINLISEYSKHRINRLKLNNREIDGFIHPYLVNLDLDMVGWDI